MKVSLFAVALLFANGLHAETLRPPSVPLVACDPYFSIWSPADNLTDADTTHWTGKPHRLTSLVWIDGKAYRVMGTEPADVPALAQKSLTVLPTRTIYTFEGAGVALTLTFMTPALPDDLDVLARPVTYVVYELRTTDGKRHEIACYFDAAAELAVNTADQEVDCSLEQAGPITATKIGSRGQPVLGKRGDDLRIDWGYLYVATAPGSGARHHLLHAGPARQAFASGGEFPMVKMGMPQPAKEAPVAAVDFAPFQVAAEPVTRRLLLAYDDLYAIQYMKKNLRPYWRRNGWEAADLLNAAEKDFETLRKRCAAFDAELMADLRKAGGEQYALLAALAYRQCFAASKFVADENGQPLSFSKENHSNGCIGTSDVFYPMAPQFLLFGPSIAKSFLVPFMDYAASDRWKFPFAPHDLGTYPHANGQRYGGGERSEENQMPVEESGNLLILMAAIAEMEGNADFAGRYWPQLQKWAAYLAEKGFDPENQLCTDDFAGHLAHNVNLSAKAICGLGAFGRLCARRGDQAQADKYTALAKEFVARWVKEAADGDHAKLAFDKPGSWSQKYNLVWDRILGLDLFPDSVRRTEMDYYRKIQNPYGLPLDNRRTYTKLDWTIWSATLTQDRGDFEALVAPVFKFVNETPDRSPLTDWYETKSAKKVGFTARPVVGGVFLPLLYDRAVWRKYADRDTTRAKGWAPMPQPPVLTLLVPTANEAPAEWKYTTEKPADGWERADFDDKAWKTGRSGFGTAGTPGGVITTVWNTPDIWLRRTFTLASAPVGEVKLSVHHDEDAEVFLNGISAARLVDFTTGYESADISPAAAATLKSGSNSMAIHCRQVRGGQYIDAGLTVATQRKKSEER